MSRLTEEIRMAVRANGYGTPGLYRRASRFKILVLRKNREPEVWDFKRRTRRIIHADDPFTIGRRYANGGTRK